MSRTNDRKFLFDRGGVKTQLVDALKKAAAFSGVEIDAYAAMDNHFHVVCKVTRGAGPVPEGALLKRVAQIGAGKVFGSSAFVAKWVFNLGSCLKSRSAGPVPVGEWAFASHGWRLAKACGGACPHAEWGLSPEWEDAPLAASCPSCLAGKPLQSVGIFMV